MTDSLAATILIRRNSFRNVLMKVSMTVGTNGEQNNPTNRTEIAPNPSSRRRRKLEKTLKNSSAPSKSWV